MAEAHFRERFSVGRLLGRGGMGEVHAAHDARLNREVALKRIRADQVSDDDRRRMVREARALAAISSSHIVQVFDLVDEDDELCIVMERLHGTSLRVWLQRERPSDADVLEILAQALSGLADAHGAGLVHRDVKPDNIFVVDRTPAVAKLLDFGIAKAVDGTTSGDRLVGGTPGYLAPEVLKGLPATAQADVFAVGAILYRHVAKRLPYGDASGAMYLRAVYEGKYRPIESLLPGLHPALIALINSALAYDPAQRTSSARDMRDEVLACAQLLRSHAPIAKEEVDANSAVRVVADRYRLTRLLGKGGMGEVFEAESLLDGGARVAVKLLRERSTDRERARFEREGRAAARSNSRHVVRVLETGIDERSGRHYLVMDRLDGEDLSQLLARTGALPPTTALRVASHVCAGLADAHEAGIVHRDIKPSNIFLSQDGSGEVVAKILDFGIAKNDLAKDATVTEQGAFIGTPLYASPEQVMGGELDARCDVWALGIVLYEMLVGKVPYPPGVSLMQIVAMIGSARIPLVQHEAPWVDAETAALVARALRVAPSERIANGRDMLHELQALLAPGPLLAGDLRGVTEEERRLRAPRADGPPTDPEAAVSRVQPVSVRASPLRARARLAVLGAFVGLASAFGAAGIANTSSGTSPPAVAPRETVPNISRPGASVAAPSADLPAAVVTASSTAAPPTPPVRTMAAPSPKRNSSPGVATPGVTASALPAEEDKWPTSRK